MNTYVDKTFGSFFPILPVIITSSSGIKLETFACLDTMSTSHCADLRLIEMLHINPPMTKTLFSTITGTKEVMTKRSDIKIQGLNSNDESYLLKSVEFIPGDHLANIPVPSYDDISKFEHLQILKEQYKPLQVNRVSILIGASASSLHVALDIKCSNNPSLPIAIKTRLGWTIFGGTDVNDVVSVNSIRKAPDTLIDDLSILWAIESQDLFLPRNGLSINDGRALEIMKNTYKKRSNGSPEMSMLFTEEPNFPNNRALAEKLLMRLIKRILKNPDSEFLQKYHNQVLKYLTTGHGRIVDPSEPRPNPGRLNYLYHQAAMHRRKSEPRIVFNCSGEFMGVSLNQKLYSGPDLINLLIGVIIRFMTGGDVAVCGDIRAMYHCVSVPDNQRSLLRWLWFENGDPKGKIIELEMCVHIFGCLSSSAVANFALRQCAVNFSETSQVYKEITRSFYVDDYLASFENAEIARKTVNNLFTALKDGGFTLTKFCASDPVALGDIPDEHIVKPEDSPSKEIKSHDMPEQVALGIRWDPNIDSFLFKVTEMNLVMTKRGVASAIARILHDPCGIIAPIIILPARLLFQDVCRRGVGWDDPLTDDEEKHFCHWYKNLIDLDEIVVRRCVRPPGFGKVKFRELHFLSDASEKCYGTCCFLREVSEINEVSCSLIFAKSRLAPLRKILTLVKLELQGAVTSIMAKNLLLPELNFNVDKIHFWTDSMPVLGYIANDSKRFQVFTSNRIAQIRASSEVEQWHWLPTSMNTSDIVTRGIRDGEKFNQHHEWFKGPEFLHQLNPQYPEAPCNMGIVSNDDPELRKKQSNFATKNVKAKTFTELFLVKFGNLYSLKFAIAIMKKFIAYKVRKEIPKKVSISDLRDAENILVRCAQKESFSSELEYLRQKPNSPLPKTSNLRKLAPILGPDGLLRIGGRMQNSNASYNFKHPIILPKRHHVTEIMIDNYHRSSGHGSVKHILNEIRLKYYIVNGRSAVYSFWNNCLECKRYRVRPGEQYMHVLPESRVKMFDPPFTYCSVDLFGHYFVRIGRSDVKRWGAIFICDETKNVHIEIVHHLDMDSFINALRRMIGRRTVPKQLRSDQGSNLKAADREISEAIQTWNESGIENRLLQKGIEWIFVPPKASHMNGLAERIIRSAREKLVHVLLEQKLTDESLDTLMIECESMLNNRPIDEFSSDPNDGRALTPIDLIQPHNEQICLPPGIFKKEDTLLKSRWRQVQYLSDVFWKRMIKETYQILQKRQKWFKKAPNFKVNDLVLLVDNDAHRGDWKFGRIISVKLSSDFIVRSCTVKTRSGSVLDRPISKLCMMEAAP